MTLLTQQVDTIVAAGSFGQWLTQARAALRGNGGSEVPCGDCVGCCTSAYSIRVRPQDIALEIIPAKLLSSMPGLAYPHTKMNPLANGHCPMFKQGKCCIYAQRPQTCLDYDCRIFAAAGMEAGADKPVINQRVRQWRFTYATPAEQQAHQAVQAAAMFIQQHRMNFPAGQAPVTPAAIAVLAVKAYRLFFDADLQMVDDVEMVNAIIHTSRAFDLNR
jgi:uncharacterized protein